MKKLITILLIFFTLNCQSQTNFQSKWQANKDIFYHNIAGHAISMTSGWVFYKVTKHRRVGLSLMVGTTTGIVAGILKEELWDRQWGFGTPSLDDKLATGWGSIGGTVCLVVVIDKHQKKLIEMEEYELMHPIFRPDSLRDSLYIAPNIR